MRCTTITGKTFNYSFSEAKLMRTPYDFLDGHAPRLGPITEEIPTKFQRTIGPRATRFFNLTAPKIQREPSDEEKAKHLMNSLYIGPEKTLVNAESTPKQAADIIISLLSELKPEDKKIFFAEMVTSNFLQKMDMAELFLTMPLSEQQDLCLQIAINNNRKFGKRWVDELCEIISKLPNDASREGVFFALQEKWAESEGGLYRCFCEMGVGVSEHHRNLINLKPQALQMYYNIKQYMAAVAQEPAPFLGAVLGLNNSGKIAAAQCLLNTLLQGNTYDQVSRNTAYTNYFKRSARLNELVKKLENEVGIVVETDVNHADVDLNAPPVMTTAYRVVAPEASFDERPITTVVPLSFQR